MIQLVKSKQSLVPYCASVNFLVFILYYSYIRCYHRGKLCVKDVRGFSVPLLQLLVSLYFKKSFKKVKAICSQNLTNRSLPFDSETNTCRNLCNVTGMHPCMFRM